MTEFPYRCALIIGAGPGISASLARHLSKIGVQVSLAARDADKLSRWRRRLALSPSRSTPPSGIK
jgi:short-subunit dehydrogenase